MQAAACQRARSRVLVSRVLCLSCSSGVFVFHAESSSAPGRAGGLLEVARRAVDALVRATAPACSLPRARRRLGVWFSQRSGRWTEGECGDWLRACRARALSRAICRASGPPGLDCPVHEGEGDWRRTVVNHECDGEGWARGVRQGGGR